MCRQSSTPSQSHADLRSGAPRAPRHIIERLSHQRLRGRPGPPAASPAHFGCRLPRRQRLLNLSRQRSPRAAGPCWLSSRRPCHRSISSWEWSTFRASPYSAAMRTRRAGDGRQRAHGSGQLRREALAILPPRDNYTGKGIMMRQEIAFALLAVLVAGIVAAAIYARNNTRRRRIGRQMRRERGKK